MKLKVKITETPQKLISVDTENDDEANRIVKKGIEFEKVIQNSY